MRHTFCLANYPSCATCFQLSLDSTHEKHNKLKRIFNGPLNSAKNPANYRALFAPACFCIIIRLEGWGGFFSSSMQYMHAHIHWPDAPNSAKDLTYVGCNCDISRLRFSFLCRNLPPVMQRWLLLFVRHYGRYQEEHFNERKAVFFILCSEAGVWGNCLNGGCFGQCWT